MTPENKSTAPKREISPYYNRGAEVLRSDENISAGQDLYKKLDESLQVDDLRKKRAEVEGNLSRDDVSDVHEAVVEIDKLEDERWTKRLEGDKDGADYIRAKQQRLRQEVESNPNYGKYLQLREELSGYADIEREYAPTYVINADDPLADSVLKKVIESTEGGRADHTSAPFAHYKENSGVEDANPAWKNVNINDVKEYLDGKPFINTQYLNVSEDKVRLRIKSKDGIDIPLSAIVSVAGFESWRGRREGIEKSWKSEFGWGTMGSLAVMMSYASLNTPLPSVAEIRVYVQPNGVVFADNGSGDSHRIGAAYLRGDKSIKAQSVVVNMVPSGTLEKRINK